MKEKNSPSFPVVLAAKQLCIHFPQTARPLFSELDWEIEAHQSTALLGPTGSGKSVLLKVLAGLISPHAGKVLFRGESVFQMKREELRAFRRALGMTFQKDGLFDSLTCGENLRLPLWEVEKISGREADKRVQEALESVELGGQQHLKVFEMSGGMQKRLGIARALLFRPSVLLYDEPTAGLDPITSRTILDLIRAHQTHTRCTMVIVSSQPLQVERVTDSAAFLFNGKLATSRPWAEWKKEKTSAMSQFLEARLEGPLTSALHEQGF